MPVGTCSNHWKFFLAHKLFKAHSHASSVTFDNTAKTITRSAGSFIADGFAIGDIIYTSSANVNNQGPFLVSATSALSLSVMTVAGGVATLTDMTETVSLGTTLVNVLLMRSGFVFNKDLHATLDNIRKTVIINATGNRITVSNLTNTFTRTSGSFLIDGFVIGNRITTSNFINVSNNGTWLISNVTASAITVTTLIGSDPVLVDEINTTATNLIFASNDELATGFGYTQDSMLLGRATLEKDDANDRLNITFPTITWTARGGNIGPTPGALYRIRGQGNPIIGYLAFDMEEIATVGTTLDIGSQAFRIS